MAYCRECGASIDEEAKFCPECGTPAGGETAAPPEEASPAATSQPTASGAAPAKKAISRKQGCGCLVVAVVAAIIVVAALVGPGTKGGSTSKKSPAQQPTPVRLTAKEKREYNLIAAFLPKGKKIEDTEMNARASVGVNQSQADALRMKALDLYAAALIAVNKDGFFTKHVRAGGALKQLEKLFVAYRDNLSAEIYAKSEEEFAFFYPDAQVAREQVQAELNRIAGIQ